MDSFLQPSSPFFLLNYFFNQRWHMKVYFLSGLGADERVFRLLDLSFCEPVFLQWIRPLPGESLAAYALRMRAQVPETHPAIVGVSFGGMLAVEMAKQDALLRAVIISSAKTRAELPGWIKASRYWQVYKWLPHELMRWIARRCNWLFGAEQPHTKKIFQSIIDDSNISFDTWAIDAVIHWQNTIVPPNVVHIHGSKDRLLRYAQVHCHETIPGGHHLMVLDHAGAISALLKQYLSRGTAG
jgi:pimeloyl-ACP methyl ester carboxylesterase